MSEGFAGNFTVSEVPVIASAPEIPVGHIVAWVAVAPILGTPVGAILLRLAAKIVTGIHVPFERSCLIAFIAAIVSGITSALVVLAISSQAGRLIAPLLVWPSVAILATSALCRSMIRAPGAPRAISFCKGVFISLLAFLMAVALLAVAGLLAVMLTLR